MVSEKTSPKIRNQQLEQIDELERKFGNEINSKYAQPYSVWARRSLIPPALHIVWTTYVFYNLSPTSGSALFQYCDINAPSQFAMDGTVGSAIHVASCLVLIGAFINHLKSNVFLHTFPRPYVNQMPPWLIIMYALREEAGFRKIVSAWPFVFTNPLSRHQTRAMYKEGAPWSDVKKGFLNHAIGGSVLSSWALLGTAGFVVLWPASLTQVVYLLMVFLAARIRDYAYAFYLARRHKEIKLKMAIWAPLNPRSK